MPIHLEPQDVSAELEGFDSVLIVSCPVCPPVSLASEADSPLFDFFRHGIKTPAYEKFIGGVRESLEADGVKTGLFTSHFPCAAACLWTGGQRSRLRRRAEATEPDSRPVAVEALESRVTST